MERDRLIGVYAGRITLRDPEDDTLTKDEAKAERAALTVTNIEQLIITNLKQYGINATVELTQTDK